MSQFTCLIHGKNTTHDTRDCKVVRAAVEGAQKVKPKKEKKAKRVQDDNDTNTESETKTVSQAAKVASPPHCQHTGDCTDTSWNADSGATAHMTPHQKWIHNMKPCKVPVHLANNDVVWATGRGSMVFSLLINGKPSPSIEFTHVLYVPDLETNHFSVLSAVRQSKLKVIIEDDTMSFLKDGILLFT